MKTPMALKDIWKGETVQKKGQNSFKNIKTLLLAEFNIRCCNLISLLSSLLHHHHYLPLPPLFFYFPIFNMFIALFLVCLVFVVPACAKDFVAEWGQKTYNRWCVVLLVFAFLEIFFLQCQTIKIDEKSNARCNMHYLSRIGGNSECLPLFFSC